jgi:hypothetical protein
MAITTIKETIELEEFTTDAKGSCYIQKRINLKEGYSHSLLQTDMHTGSYIHLLNEPTPFEVVIAPYPAVPTNMYVSDQYPDADRLVAGGNDAVLFKVTGLFNSGNPVSPGVLPMDFEQFPSPQIASAQRSIFYSDHIYISLHFIGNPSTTYYNLNCSFMMVVDDKKIGSLTSSLGKMVENHQAMVARIMSQGHMITRAVLLGNTFPMWRFGGIRPEHMLSPDAAGSFFLQIPSFDEELMQSTANIRSAVADARGMGAYDAPFGDRFPDWCRFDLNEGLASGPVRDQWPPIKHADNGNVLCL